MSKQNEKKNQNKQVPSSEQIEKAKYYVRLYFKMNIACIIVMLILVILGVISFLYGIQPVFVAVVITAVPLFMMQRLVGKNYKKLRAFLIYYKELDPKEILPKK